MSFIVDIIIALFGVLVCYLGFTKRLSANKHVNTVLLFIGFWFIAIGAYYMIFH